MKFTFSGSHHNNIDRRDHELSYTSFPGNQTQGFFPRELPFLHPHTYIEENAGLPELYFDILDDRFRYKNKANLNNTENDVMVRSSTNQGKILIT